MNVQRFGFEICLLRRPESRTRTCFSKFWLNPRTRTEAGYVRCGDENHPTVLSWILLSDLPILRDGTACHACIQSLKHFVACADLHREKKKRKELAIYATLDYIQKELLHCCQRRKNETVFEFLVVGNKGKIVLFYSVKGSVRFSTFKFVTACSELP